jgi:DNA-directed RNA polymerase subunit RPC12/RpoP
MIMGIETCSNCGRTIGSLEQAFVFEDHVVCAQCNDLLTKEQSKKQTPQGQPSSNQITFGKRNKRSLIFYRPCSFGH